MTTAPTFDVAPLALPATVSSRPQQAWAARPIAQRMTILRATRHELARLTPALAAAIPRNPADTRVAEVLPLLAACKFLEQHAAAILAPRRLGRRGLPLWLSGVSSEIRRVPVGHVLVIGPANYPLFLPGVQALQALTAGNAVTWKPGRGGQPVARLVAEALHSAGLPAGLLTITAESIEAAQTALRTPPDKVFFTGSAMVGRQILHQLADTLIPSVMELSGSDAVIVLPSADLSRVVLALAFGMRLNGSATCMAPRRVLLVGASADRRQSFLTQLRTALATVPTVPLTEPVVHQLRTLLHQATLRGAQVEGSPDHTPILVTHATPEMSLLQADLFAPILSVVDLADEAGIHAAQAACPYALTAAIFGDEHAARHLASTLTVGTVTINDLIVPTADPRVPFGGQRDSGFGTTRGAEGLLEMTAVQVIATRRGHGTRHFEPTGAAHQPLFDGIIAATYAGTWRERLQGWKQFALAGRDLSKKS